MILHDLKRYQTRETDPQCLMDPLTEHPTKCEQIAKFDQKSCKSITNVHLIRAPRSHWHTTEPHWKNPPSKSIYLCRQSIPKEPTTKNRNLERSILPPKKIRGDQNIIIVIIIGRASHMWECGMPLLPYTPLLNHESMSTHRQHQPAKQQ